MPATALLSSDVPVGSDLDGDLGSDDPTHAICPYAPKMECPGCTRFDLFSVVDRCLYWVEHAESGACEGDIGGGAMKTNKTLIKELRAELHYWQMQVRMDMKSLESTKERAREIAAKMRKLQKAIGGSNV